MSPQSHRFPMMNRPLAWLSAAAFLLAVAGVVPLLKTEPVLTLEANGSFASLATGAPDGATIVLAPGKHEGFTVDRPLTVVAEPGALVAGEVRVLADEVRLEGVVIEAPEDGITVLGADDVVIEEAAVTSALHGIQVAQGSVHVTSCRISGLGEYGQGFEIRNSNGRPRTVVEGCTVIGGMEGIVSHVSRVEFLRNHVTGTTQAGLMITEMSEGIAEGNTVAGAVGTGLYCGDMSHCEFRRNTIAGVAPDPRGVKSRAGFGAVASYYATMRLTGNDFDVSSDEPVGLFTGSIITERFPLGFWPPGLQGLIPGLGVTAIALGGIWALRALIAAARSQLKRPATEALPISARAAVAVLLAGFVVQSFHMLEHTVQVFQVHALQAEKRAGLVGHLFNTEWFHFGFNVAVIVFLLWSLRVVSPAETSRSGGHSVSWLMAATAVQGYHVAEHIAKVVQHLNIGVNPAPGVIGAEFGLVWFHFGINLAVYAGMSLGIFHGVALLAGDRKFKLGSVRRLLVSERGSTRQA